MNKNLRYYRISESDLRELLMAANTYWALESWGVDNWIGWGEAQRNYVEDCSDIDFVHYEDIEEIVEANLANYPICTCKEEKSPTFAEIVDLLP